MKLQSQPLAEALRRNVELLDGEIHGFAGTVLDRLNRATRIAGQMSREDLRPRLRWPHFTTEGKRGDCNVEARQFLPQLTKRLNPTYAVITEFLRLS